jgi:hypothetical protein
MLHGHRDLKVFQLAYLIGYGYFSSFESFSQRRIVFVDRPNSANLSQCRCEYC